MFREHLIRLRAVMAQAAEKAGRDAGEIQLVAVSKFVSPEQIQEAVACGQTFFGESYLQEAASKIPLFPSSIKWHCIGHLQSNKARQAAALFDVVETIDRLKIAKALDNNARLLEKKLAVLLQVNTGRERQKSGVLVEETETLLRQIRQETALQVLGLMTLPPYSPNPEHSRPYFKTLNHLAQRLARQGLFADNSRVELSMGMSHDFPVAIEEGATIIRVGTALFGERPIQG